MNRRSFFAFAAVFMMILMTFSFALAEEPLMTFLDGNSGKVNFNVNGCSSSWATVSMDGTPILAINVEDTSKLEGVSDLYFKIPVTITLQKPERIADKEATPYVPVQQVDDNGMIQVEFESVTSGSFIYHIFVPCNEIYDGLGDAFAIRWQDASGNILMREMLQYSVSTSEPNPFDAESRPKGRVTVTLDELLTAGINPAVTYEFAENGDLTFTVHKISKEVIKALYLPGMNGILADVKVSAPAGYSRLWSASGDMLYQEFVDGYTNGSFEINRKEFSNGRRLWQIDETDNEITVIPLERVDHYYMLCWQNEAGTKYPEVLKINIVMADDAVVVTVPKDELDDISDVPAERISAPGISDTNSKINKAGAVFSKKDGLALFEMNGKTPKEVIDLATSNNWNSIPIDVWISVPDGCKEQGTVTINGWTKNISFREQNGVKYAEIGRGIYDSSNGIISQDVNVIIKWDKADGGTMVEKFRLKSTFPNHTWMDIYWTPASTDLLSTSLDKDTLEKFGYEVSIADGKVHCTFKDGVLPTVEQMQQLMNLQINLMGMPEAAVKARFNSSNGNRSTEYSTRAANKQKEFVENSTPVNPNDLWLGNLCPLDKRSVGNEGIDYYCTIIEENHVILIQFYDSQGNLIEVGPEGNKKLGYYYTIEVEPFHYALSSSVVDDISKAEKDSSGIVEKPTLVLPDLGANTFTFTAQLFPQQINSSDKNPNIKYYLRLETDVPAAMLEDGVDVYIPYSMIHPDLTYEKALDDKKFKVKHLYDDDSHKENLTGEPTEYGMKFVVDSFSPFVIEVEEPEPIIKVVPSTTPVYTDTGITIRYMGGNSFSTSNSAVPTSVEIDGVPVSFTGDGRSFTVSSISAGAKWVTVKWNSTTVTTNFTPDANAVCAEISLPKTGDMSFWAAVAAFFGF